MSAVKMSNQGAYGTPMTCTVVGELVRETPKSYVFRHPFFTAGEDKRVSQLSGAYHVETCRYCPTWVK